MRPVGQGAAKRQLCVPKTPWSKSDPSPRTPPAPRASLTERGAGGVCAPVSSGHAQPLGNSDPATVRSPRLLLRGTMLLTAATGRSLQRRRAWDGALSLMSRGPPFFSPAECRWLRWRMSLPLGSIVIGNEGLLGKSLGEPIHPLRWRWKTPPSLPCPRSRGRWPQSPFRWPLLPKRRFSSSLFQGAVLTPAFCPLCRWRGPEAPQNPPTGFLPAWRRQEAWGRERRGRRVCGTPW